MLALIKKVKGKLAYLNRKIALYQWKHRDGTTVKTIDLAATYLEIKEFSGLKKLKFSFDSADYKDRFSKRHVFCGIINEDDKLMAYGWLNNADQHYLGELNLMITLSKNNCMLYDFQTFEAYKGKGLYPFLLQCICTRDTNSKIIYAFPANTSSCKGIIKAEFKFLGNISGFTKNNYTKMIED